MSNKIEKISKMKNDLIEDRILDLQANMDLAVQFIKYAYKTINEIRSIQNAEKK